MIRWNTIRSPHKKIRRTSTLIQALLAAVAVTTVLSALPMQSALAQQGQILGLTPNQARNFPAAAQYGTLVLGSNNVAQLNGKPIQLAPGLRLFNEANHLVMANNMQGQRLRVRYLTEGPTNMLLTAWILREVEMPPRRAWGLLGPAEQDPQDLRTGPAPMQPIVPSGATNAAEPRVVDNSSAH